MGTSVSHTTPSSTSSATSSSAADNLEIFNVTTTTTSSKKKRKGERENSYGNDDEEVSLSSGVSTTAIQSSTRRTMVNQIPPDSETVDLSASMSVPVSASGGPLVHVPRILLSVVAVGETHKNRKRRPPTENKSIKNKSSRSAY
jgi:hypothetical protein